MVAFQKVLEKSMIASSVKEEVFKIAKSFDQRGRTKQNIRTYHRLDK